MKGLSGKMERSHQAASDSVFKLSRKPCKVCENANLMSGIVKKMAIFSLLEEKESLNGEISSNSVFKLSRKLCKGVKMPVQWVELWDFLSVGRIAGSLNGEISSNGVLKLSRRCENADSIGRIMEFSFCWKDCREFEW